MFQMHNGNEVSDLLQDYAMAILEEQDDEEEYGGCGGSEEEVDSNG